MPQRDTYNRPDNDDDARRLPPPLIAALGLGAALVVGIAVAGIVANANGSGAAGPPPSAPTAASTAATGPVPLVPVDAPLAGSPQCAALLRGLPATLGNGRTPLRRRQLAVPAPPASAAWSGPAGEPTVLRCGIERPPELTPTSELLVVDGVSWLRVTGDDTATWYAVDRAAVVALTLPGDPGTGPIQDVSTAIGAAMPAVPIFGS